MPNKRTTNILVPAFSNLFDNYFWRGSAVVLWHWHNSGAHGATFICRVYGCKHGSASRAQLTLSFFFVAGSRPRWYVPTCWFLAWFPCGIPAPTSGQARSCSRPRTGFLWARRSRGRTPCIRVTKQSHRDNRLRFSESRSRQTLAHSQAQSLRCLNAVTVITRTSNINL